MTTNQDAMEADNLVERLRFTYEHGIFDANAAGMLASPDEAVDRIEALTAQLAARDAQECDLIMESVVLLDNANGVSDEARFDYVQRACAHLLAARPTNGGA